MNAPDNEKIAPWAGLVRDRAREQRISPEGLATKIENSLKHCVSADEVRSWLDGQSLPDAIVHKHLIHALALSYDPRYPDDPLEEYRTDIESAYKAACGGIAITPAQRESLATLSKAGKVRNRGHKKPERLPFPQERPRRHSHQLGGREEHTPPFTHDDGRPNPLHTVNGVGDSLHYEELPIDRLKEIQEKTPNAIEFLICYRLLHSHGRGKVSALMGLDNHMMIYHWEIIGGLPEPDSLAAMNKYFAPDDKAALHFRELVIHNRLEIIKHAHQTGYYHLLSGHMQSLPPEEYHDQLKKFFHDGSDHIIRKRGDYTAALQRVMGLSNKEAASLLKVGKRIVSARKSYAEMHPNDGVIKDHIAKLEAAFKAWEEQQPIPEAERLSRFFPEHRWTKLPIVLANTKSHAEGVCQQTDEQDAGIVGRS